MVVSVQRNTRVSQGGKSEIDASQKLELGFDLVRAFPNGNTLLPRIIDGQ
jgi:hypothetical protein